MRFATEHVQPEGVHSLLCLVRSPFDRQWLTFDPEDFHGLFNPFPRSLRQIVLQPQFPFMGQWQYGRKFGFKNELETIFQLFFFIL